jgi:hypothetical protein
MIYGLTDNYIRVAVPYGSALENQIVDVRIGEFQGSHALGEIAGEIPGFTGEQAGRIALPVLNILRS